jgi:hypothetical protein
VQIVPLDKGDEFVPFGMRQPDGVCGLPNPDAVVGNLDLRSFNAVRAEAELDRFHLNLVLDGPGRGTYCL